MTHETPQPNPDRSREFFSALELLEQKLKIAHGISVDENSGLYRAAEIFYDSLYRPDKVIDENEIPESKDYPTRNLELASPLELRDGSGIPTFEEFSEVVTDAFIGRKTHKDAIPDRTNRTHKKSLYPEALDLVKTASGHAPTIIWTQGDEWEIGQTEPDDSKRPVSHEQLRKIIGAGLARIRRQLAEAALEALKPPTSEQDSKDPNNKQKPQVPIHEKVHDIFDVIAVRNKVNEETAKKIAEYFSAHGISKIIIIEDKLKNINDMKELLKAHGISVTGLWMRQEKYEDTEKPDDDDIVPVKDLADAIELIKKVNDKTEEASEETEEAKEKTGFLIDFDGVLSNHPVRKRLVFEEIISKLHENNWI